MISFKRIYLFIFLLLVFSWRVFSQNTDSIIISEKYVDLKLYQVFDQMQEKHNLKFFYKAEWLKDRSFSGEFTDITFDAALKEILLNTGLDFYCYQNNVVLLPREEVAFITGDMLGLNKAVSSSEAVIIGNMNLVGKFKKLKLSGIITDGANGEPLTGATVMIENTSQYTLSGYNGKYEMEIAPGSYIISASFFGFENKKVSVQAVSPGELNFELFEKSHEINEVVVTALRADENVRSHQMSVVQLDAKSIKQLPSLVGEKDILKSLTMMPGVKSVGEFGSGINVRGGGEDQNLYLIEGAPVFNTSHVMGLLSVVNPDAVHGVTLYKGHIPAEYGERVSSVLDVELKDYNCQEFHAKGGIGIYNSRLLFEGPLFNKKVTYKIGGRTSYSDYLLKQMPDYYLMHSSAKFYDLTGLVNIALKNNPISLFGYYSYDYFKYADNFIYNYGNKLGSAQWSHIFSSYLSTNIKLSYSNYSITRDDYMNIKDQHSIWSQVKYFSGKFNTSFTGINKNKFDIGFQGIKYNIAPGDQTPISGPDATYKSTEREQAVEFSAFANDVIELNQNITLQLGLRYTRYSYLGPKTIYNYSGSNSGIFDDPTDSIVYSPGTNIVNYSGIEPRLSVKFQIDKQSSLKLSYNKNIQYLGLLSYTSISTPEDVWKLSDLYIKPLTVNQIALGLYRNFSNNLIETSVELYYKNQNNVLEYINGAELSLNNHIESELINAYGKNYGIELFVRKSSGRWDGWVTYTYSRALKQTKGNSAKTTINNNTVYPSQFDKPHDLTIYANYHYNRRLRFGANFALSSGRPVTLPEYTFYAGNKQLIYYSDRNKYRLPTYHRLDFSVSYDESLRKNKKWKGSWTFSVLNVYARKNAYSIFYKQETPSEFNNYELFSLYKLYLIGKPLPTLTYNFIF